MTTYADVINAMIDARERGFETGDIEKLVLTDETMDTFLTDDSFNRELEERQKDTIGTSWEIKVESGEYDHLRMSNGEEFDL